MNLTAELLGFNHVMQANTPTLFQFLSFSIPIAGTDQVISMIKRLLGRSRVESDSS
jgi:hypothetical protein